MNYKELCEDLVNKGYGLSDHQNIKQLEKSFGEPKMVGKFEFEEDGKKYYLNKYTFPNWANQEVFIDFCYNENGRVFRVENVIKDGKQFKTITQVRVIDAINEEQLEERINNFIKDKKVVDIKPLVSGGSEFLYLAAMIIYKTEVEVDEN